ncbi:hypothetical protein [Pseudoalteromonas rubra]|nr:hypothetical protein [Pseudoalteromonas rubra]
MNFLSVLSMRGKQFNTISSLALVTGLVASPAFANSVVGKVTHSLSVSGSGSVYENSTVSWSPLTDYSNLNFSYVKLGIKAPGSGYSYSNLSSSSYSFRPSKAGKWCFMVRGWHEGEFGLFNSEQCMNVSESISGLVTHSMSVPSTGNTYKNTTITWSPLPAFSTTDFSYVKLGIRSPNGSWRYPNFGGSSYTFTPDQKGTWCFKVRGVSGGTFGLYNTQKCMTANDSVSQFVTHSLNVPTSAALNNPMKISWAPLPAFSDRNFSYVKLGTKAPGATWSFKNVSASDINITPNTAGQWCFQMRGVADGVFSLFTAQQCVNVQTSVNGLVTHEVTPIPVGVEGDPMAVKWSALPDFEHLDFSYVKLYVTRPNGTAYHDNYPEHGEYQFNPNQPGSWCFRVRGKYDVLGLYSNDVCTKVKHRNMLFDGEFTHATSTDLSPFNSHQTYHIGDWNIVDVNGDKKIRFTTPVLSEQLNDPVTYELDSYQQFYDYCTGAQTPYANFKSFRCIKSEITFGRDNYEDGADVSAGATSWYAYEFTIDKMLSKEECISKKSNHCYVFISQFHTTSAHPHLSPNNAVLLRYTDDSFSDISLNINTKVDCDNPALTGTSYCNDPKPYCAERDEDENCILVRKYQQHKMGSLSGLREGETYLIKMKIKWDTGLNGRVTSYIKRPEEADFVQFGDQQNIQTLPENIPLVVQTGMYWGGLDPRILFPNGDNGSPMTVTLDKIQMVRDACHLPDIFKSQSELSSCH